MLEENHRNILSPSVDRITTQNLTDFKWISKQFISKRKVYSLQFTSFCNIHHNRLSDFCKKKIERKKNVNKEVKKEKCVTNESKSGDFFLRCARWTSFLTVRCGFSVAAGILFLVTSFPSALISILIPTKLFFLAG